MKLAVNYSKEAEGLLQESKIDVDLFKCPEFSKEIIRQKEEIKPCYVHFGLNAGQNRMDKVNWQAIHDLRKHTNTPYVNVHAVAFAKDYPEMDILTTEPADKQRIIEVVVKDIQTVAEQVGMEHVIVENVICRGEGENMLKPIIEPEILTEIVERTGCGFLLDTAHAQMTSKSLNLDVKSYISQLPVTQLKELHITGIQQDQNGRLRDSMPMTEDDWDIACWVLNHIANGDWPEPWAVAFEYGGVGPKFEWRSEKDVLAKQVPRLVNLLHGTVS